MSMSLFASLLPQNGLKAAVPSTCRWSSTAAAVSAFTSQRVASWTDKRKVAKPNRLRFLEDQKAQNESRALEKFQTRNWQSGDIYAPRDLSPVEMKKRGRRQSPSRDAFDALNLDPLSLYKNFSIMSEYVSP
ncbi:hypothetical protein N7470_010419 [Penicillium chermesinum]|nr:hypothetical protein N7470_010419 [Penicillium chermesinum]